MWLVTGATARSNIINVHDEFGGYTVSDRIKHATLTMLFQVVRGTAPAYLINILLDLNGPKNYILQNNANLLKSTLLQVTNLQEVLLSQDYVSGFGMISPLKASPKTVLKTSKNYLLQNTKKYKFSIIMENNGQATMRISCSKLNNDLFHNLHVIDSVSCTCGAQYDHVEHFFLCCPQFNVIRCHLIGDILVVMPIDSDHNLIENPDYDVE